MIDVLTRSLAETDTEVHAAIGAELRRQQGTLEMIASENFVSPAVLEAVQRSLGLDDDALAVTWGSLRDVGNLSSASVLHVLERSLLVGVESPVLAGERALLAEQRHSGVELGLVE